MKKLIFWGTILSGAGAAYLMYRRGVPLTKIARDIVKNPLGTLKNELKTAL